VDQRRAGLQEAGSTVRRRRKDVLNPRGFDEAEDETAKIGSLVGKLDRRRTDRERRKKKAHWKTVRRG